MPIAVLEAMAHGCPTVVSDIAENIEAVGDAALTFPVGNPDALRQVLGVLLARPEKARDLAKASHLDAVASRNSELLELYRAGKPFHESPAAGAIR